MEIKLHWLITLIMAATITGCLIGYGLPNQWFNTHKDPQYNANVFYIFETAHGTYGGMGGNVITNIGENTIRNLLGFGNATAGTAEIGTNKTDYISLGNATAAATLTQLTTECDNSSAFGRAQGTVVAWMNGTDYAYNVSKTFTANATVTINCCGLQWFSQDVSNNNLFACADITQTAFAVNDNCTITWVVTCDFN